MAQKMAHPGLRCCCPDSSSQKEAQLLRFLARSRSSTVAARNAGMRNTCVLPSLYPDTWQPTDLFAISVVLSSPECPIWVGSHGVIWLVNMHFRIPQISPHGLVAHFFCCCWMAFYWLVVPHFIYLFAYEEYLHCFHVWAVINKDIINLKKKKKTNNTSC